MEIKDRNFYFVGIGGIGMSALARYFHQMGGKVVGYDRTISQLTKRLQTEGIAVNYIDDADAIPFDYRDKDQTLIIYTPAIPDENSILTYFMEEGFSCMKRAEVLGELSKEFKTIAVAGTHGKTTISTMIAFLLNNSGIKVNAFLGGISRNFGTNVLINPEAKWLVTEADEFDKSFLQLNPDILIITSLDADHLDIYTDRSDLIATYGKLVSQINFGGSLICKASVKLELEEYLPKQVHTYHLKESADIKAENIKVTQGELSFNCNTGEKEIFDLKCGLPGKHNVENSLAAIQVAFKFNLTEDQIRTGLSQFQGIKRRFDVHINTDELVYIDDYAHHPEEIRALIESVQLLYPQKKVTTVFQPHLYSRTKDFADDFAKSLALSDELILLEIYPAREEPIEGISSIWLAKKTNKEDVPVCQKHQLINILKERNLEVLLTVGAGDIDTLVDPIIDHLDSKL